MIALKKIVFISIIALVIILAGSYKVSKIFVERKIDAYIEQYGIPESDISKSTLDYNIFSGDYEKRIWTYTDNDEDIFYLVSFASIFSARDYGEIGLDFYLYGNAFNYYGTERDHQEFQSFLKRHDWQIAYPPKK